LLAFVLDKVRSSGQFVESVVVAVIDEIMDAALEFVKTIRRLPINTNVYSKY